MDRTPIIIDHLKCLDCSLKWYMRHVVPTRVQPDPPALVCPRCGNADSSGVLKLNKSDLIVIGEPTFYHLYDPAKPEGAEMWSFTYLHGPAEEYVASVAQERDWEWNAPDIIVSDMPSPLAPGMYFCRLYGRQLVVVMDWHNGRLGGQAAFPIEGDEYYRHLFNSERWR